MGPRETVIRRWVASGWNRGDFSEVQRVYSPSYVLHDPAGEVRGPDGLVAFVSGFRDAFPNITFEIQDVFESGDKACWRWTMRGRQEKAFAGIPVLTGNLEVTGLLLTRFEGGLWAEDWVEYDSVGMLRGLGVMEAASAV